MQGFSTLGDWTMMNPWKGELDKRCANEYHKDHDDAVHTMANTSFFLTLATMLLQLFDGTFPTWFK